MEQRKRARAEKKALKKKKKTRGADKHRADEDDEKEWGDDEEGNIWQDFHTWNILDFQTGCQTAQRTSFWNRLRIRSRRASLVAQTVKNSRQCGRCWLGPWVGKIPGEGNGNLLQYLAWRTLWTEEPGRLQSMGWHRVGHSRASNTRKVPAAFPVTATPAGMPSPAVPFLSGACLLPRCGLSLPTSPVVDVSVPPGPGTWLQPCPAPILYPPPPPLDSPLVV